MSGLTVVVPAFDEAGNLSVVVEEVARVASALPRWEVVIVDDASTDATPAEAAALAQRLPGVRWVRHPHNQGSGGAILTGIAEARCELVMYVPADGQFHVPEIAEYVAAAEHADIVIGSRIARSDYSWFRRLSSAVFIRLVDALFDQSFRDVNWVHLWRREVFARVKPRSRGVFMLEEVLVRACRAGFSVTEIDSRYVPRRSGQAKGSNPRTILRTVWDMGRFWLDLRLGRVP
ncbi:MAG: glycosyltransferase family 2 protein [Vicinamibacteria bacterium]|nr:glycosyltransferase family 2 protein [Vicinamibacteria bacterium]